MPLVSLEFALCFLVFFSVYWLFRKQVFIQNTLLIFAGLAFLATWNIAFVVSVLCVWLITETTVFLIQHADTKLAKRMLMQAGIFFLATQLILYKYLNFGIDQLNTHASTQISPLNIIMPLGLSFYTFQAISYIADLYQEKTKKISSFASLGIFSSFTTITAGPIFRPTDAIKQWQPENGKSRDILLPYMAMVLIVVAVLKKVVLAGWLAQVWVSPIFADPLQYHPLEVLTGIYGYALQLFFDFSGYTDLVIAIGLLLGFRLPVNFNAPYLATNIRDFWQRWHISLSQWIRDYLYIPLGGSRGNWWRTQLNLMLAFVISGMWHGAGWNFFIWGAIHGVALVWLNLCKQYNFPKLSDYAPWLAIFITFHYVCFGWVFFHSASLEQVNDILTALVSINNINEVTLPLYATLAVMLVSWLAYPWLAKTPEILADALTHIPWWAVFIPISCCLMLLFSLSPEGLPGFIYANF